MWPDAKEIELSGTTWLFGRSVQRQRSKPEKFDDRPHRPDWPIPSLPIKTKLYQAPTRTSVRFGMTPIQLMPNLPRLPAMGDRFEVQRRSWGIDLQSISRRARDVIVMAAEHEGRDPVLPNRVSSGSVSQLQLANLDSTVDGWVRFPLKA
jgi:hypothetical protein